MSAHENESSLSSRTPDVEVAAPKPEEEPAPAQKRKASSPPPEPDVNAQSPKRTKLDNDAEKEVDNPIRRLPTPKEPNKGNRESTIQEEKKRGKRLFGGLLSTLSQTTTNSQQKRRQEIERRQQAKAHQQRAEDDKHREEKLAKLNAVRKVEQLKFDEQVMRTRHANMLAAARFLHTQSRPKIYYLPWELTEEQQDTIRDQIRDVQDIIDKEVLDCKAQRLEAMGITPTVKTPTPDTKETVGKSDDEKPTDIPQPDSTNRAPTHTSKVGPEKEKESDRVDDVMIEEDEDTVIY